MKKLAPILLILLGLFLLQPQLPQGCNFKFPIGVTEPSPIPDIGFRVLITYSNDSKSSLSRDQLAIIDSSDLREWLDAHCVKDAQNVPEWRIWASEIQTNPDQPIWQKLMGLERKSEPWITISTGRTGFSGPLPANEAETIKLLEKYAS